LKLVDIWKRSAAGRWKGSQSRWQTAIDNIRVITVHKSVVLGQSLADMLWLGIGGTMFRPAVAALIGPVNEFRPSDSREDGAK
jgi:hypothetical protein